MKETVFNEWLKALKSGDYKKGEGWLHWKENNTYCCLGVLEAVCGVDEVPEIDFANKTGGVVHAHRGLSSARQAVLAKLNDLSDTFEPIIAYLEKNRDKIVKD